MRHKNDLRGPDRMGDLVPGDLFSIIQGSNQPRWHEDAVTVWTCLWTTPYTGEDDKECCWVGALRLGRRGLNEKWLEDFWRATNAPVTILREEG